MPPTWLKVVFSSVVMHTTYSLTAVLNLQERAASTKPSASTQLAAHWHEHAAQLLSNSPHHLLDNRGPVIWAQRPLHLAFVCVFLTPIRHVRPRQKQGVQRGYAHARAHQILRCALTEAEVAQNVPL